MGFNGFLQASANIPAVNPVRPSGSTTRRNLCGAGRVPAEWERIQTSLYITKDEHCEFYIEIGDYTHQIPLQSVEPSDICLQQPVDQK